jgi:hypothetical protein
MISFCPCPGALHDVACAMNAIAERRLRLYEGLYDGPAGEARGSSASRVRLLNAGLFDPDGDATTRRFALLEID